MGQTPRNVKILTDGRVPCIVEGATNTTQHNGTHSTQEIETMAQDTKTASVTMDTFVTGLQTKEMTIQEAIRLIEVSAPCGLKIEITLTGQG